MRDNNPTTTYASTQSASATTSSKDSTVATTEAASTLSQSSASGGQNEILGPHRRLMSLQGLSLDVIIVLPDSENYAQTIKTAKTISSALSSGISVAGLSIQSAASPTLVYCGDGIRQTASSNVKTQDGTIYTEECDDGDDNSLYNRCASTCTCNQPAFKLDASNQSCVCQQNPRVTALITESTSVQEALNVLNITFNFLESYDFDYRQTPPYQTSPLILTISGLTGSMTLDDALDVECSDSGTIATCGLGPESNSTAFRIDKALWSQEFGVLKFTVLHPFGPKALRSSFSMSVPLKNNMYAQDARTPSIATCNGIPVPATGSVLESSAIEVSGPRVSLSSYRISKKGQQGTLSNIINLTVPSFTASEHLLLEALQASLVSKISAALLPVGARFAGLLSTAGLNYSVRAGSVASAAKPVYPNIGLSIAVNQTVLRTQGGCVNSADSHVQICLPGYVGLYRIGSDAIWRSLTAIDDLSMSLEYLKCNMSEPAMYAVISTPQCNDVGGSGRSGGDQVCLTNGDIRGSVACQLGGLIVSRMPSLSRSTRPAIMSWAEYWQYLHNATKTDSTYQTRRGWYRLCPGGAVVSAGDCPADDAAALSWFPARFGHSLAVVSTARVIIFGGLTCQAADPATGWCLQLQSLSDVWELDIQAALKGGAGLRQILMSPSPAGVIGQASVTLPDNSQRIWIVGGASQSYPYYALTGRSSPPAADSEIFVVQDLQLRLGTFTTGTVDTIGALSSHSVVLVGSLALFFGGTVRNAPTSATYKYDLSAATPTLGMSNVFAAASGPEARGYAGLVQKSQLSLILFGGVGEGADPSSFCQSTRPGLWDVWLLDLSSQSWTTVPKASFSSDPLTTSLTAFTHFTSNGADVLLLHDGIQCGYKEGITFVQSCPSTELAGSAICSNTVVPSTRIVAIPTSSKEYITLSYRKLSKSSSTPVARCMHSFLSGPFLSSITTGFIYGGLSDSGKALSDLWITEDANVQFGSCLTLGFSMTSYAPLSDPGGLLEIFAAGPGGCRPDEIAGIDLGCPAIIPGFWYPVADNFIRVILSATDEQYQSCIAPFYGPKAVGVFQRIATALNSSWAAAVLDSTVVPVPGLKADIRFDFIQFQAVSPAQGCATSCVGGFCQPPGWFTVSAPSRCYSGSECSTNYTCSVPGGRHGHTLLRFSFAGRSVVLLFGGETTDIFSKAPVLSNELFSAFFEGGSVSWVNLALGFLGSDGAEFSCEYSVRSNLGGCPAARRDAAMVLMGNSGGQNGRMLLFGGMTYCQVCLC